MGFELLLIRHAEAAHNIHGYDTATPYRYDPTLTSLGEAQSRALATWLSQHYPASAALYSSDQKRALQTAQYIYEALGLDIITDHRLRDFGACRHDGQPYPIDQIPHRQDGIIIKDVPFTPIAVDPSSESYLDMMQRTGEFLRMLMELYQNDEQVLVITHSGSMNTLPGLITGLGVYLQTMINVANASVSLIQHRSDTDYENWVIRSLGNTQHLAGLDHHDK